MYNKKIFIIFAITALLFLCINAGTVYCQDAKTHNTKGVEYRKQGLFDKAIEEFTKALQLDPKNAAAYNNRGLSYEKKKVILTKPYLITIKS